MQRIYSIIESFFLCLLMSFLLNNFPTKFLKFFTSFTKNNQPGVFCYKIRFCRNQPSRLSLQCFWVYNRGCYTGFTSYHCLNGQHSFRFRFYTSPRGKCWLQVLINLMKRIRLPARLHSGWHVLSLNSFRLKGLGSVFSHIISRKGVITFTVS